MLKWFEQVEKGNMVSCKIRLARNWEGHAFPGKLSDKESQELVKQLAAGLSRLSELDGRSYQFAFLDEMSELDRMVFKDRRILNASTAIQKRPGGIVISDNEDTSIILNGDDHIRLQVFSTGLHLEEMYHRINEIDDYINDRFPYAFDDKYGYLTSFPTNVGTGMRASVILHLPSLSLGKKFQALIHDLGRFGVSVKGMYGEGHENYGSLYEISNQKTLGLTEKEIVDLVAKSASQLNLQELQVRSMALKNHCLEREDEVYKSYGVLKYARRIAMKDAMIFLSQLMAGFADGLLKTAQPYAVYRLMLGIQPASLQRLSEKPLDREELDVARAAYLRMELPELL